MSQIWLPSEHLCRAAQQLRINGSSPEPLASAVRCSVQSKSCRKPPEAGENMPQTEVRVKAERQFQSHVYQGQAQAVKAEIPWRQQGVLVTWVVTLCTMVQSARQLPKNVPRSCDCDFLTPHEALVGFRTFCRPSRFPLCPWQQPCGHSLGFSFCPCLPKSFQTPLEKP